LVGNPEGKVWLGRKREDNIKMDVNEIAEDGVDWIYLAQGGDQWRSHVNTVINIRVP
jgi:hypothetical protein